MEQREEAFHGQEKEEGRDKKQNMAEREAWACLPTEDAETRLHEVEKQQELEKDMDHIFVDERKCLLSLELHVCWVLG